MTVTAYVGLGSNLGDRLSHLASAVAALGDLPGADVIACSSVYDTDPVGPPQPDYLNAVVAVTTTMAPRELLSRLKAIERGVGRTPAQRWGPREIDLDLLLYGDRAIADGVLTVPHPELAIRSFVLVPLAEIAPDVEVPGHGRVRDLLETAGRAGVRRHAPSTALRR